MEQVWSDLRIILWLVKTRRRVDSWTFVGLTNTPSEASNPQFTGPTPSAFPILIEMLLDFIAAALGIFSTEPDRIAGGETQGILAWLVGCRQSVENKGRDGGTDAVDLKS